MAPSATAVTTFVMGDLDVEVKAVYRDIGSSGEEGLFGDIDGDSRADATDSNLILAYCADLVTMNSNSFMAADADGSGEVDILDAYYLRQSGLSKYTVDQRGA